MNGAFMIDTKVDTKEEIERRMDELARQYGRTPPENQRRSEIFKELVGCASVLTGC
jgi:hypothetical protein